MQSMKSDYASSTKKGNIMNTTKLTTILGIVQAIGVGVADYLTHTTMEGGALKQPTFWIGLLIAGAMGLKGYFTKGIDVAPKENPNKE